jgi:hypothetical protein
MLIAHAIALGDPRATIASLVVLREALRLYRR